MTSVSGMTVEYEIYAVPAQPGIAADRFAREIVRF
jgi:hypothetical protein